MTRSCRARRLAISTFVLAHLTALAVWNVPNCVLRQRLLPAALYYVYPLGLWQNWSMFAPDPIAHTVTLEASAVDSKGMVYNFPFPKMADFSLWQRVPRVRHSKFISYFAGDEFKVNREIAARHVVRQLKIPPENFPVEMELHYLVKETPPPGQAPPVEIGPLKTHALQAYLFPTWEEVQPWH